MDEKILQALALLKNNQKKRFKRTMIVEYCMDGDWMELFEDQPIRLLWEYRIRIVDRTPK